MVVGKYLSKVLEGLLGFEELVRLQGTARGVEVSTDVGLESVETDLEGEALLGVSLVAEESDGFGENVSGGELCVDVVLDGAAKPGYLGGLVGSGGDGDEVDGIHDGCGERSRKREQASQAGQPPAKAESHSARCFLLRSRDHATRRRTGAHDYDC